jgi:hypothetical protein
MPHIDPGILLALGSFGWLIVAAVAAARGQRDGSLCVAEGANTVIFRRRRSVRGLGVLLCVLQIAVVSVLPWQDIVGAVKSHQPVPDWASLAVLFLVLIVSPLTALSLYTAGPRDLFVDLSRRSYRFVSGWPLRPSVQAGTCDEFAGIFVRPSLNPRSMRYIVQIAWRQEGHPCPVLGFFRREDDAAALADEMAARLADEMAARLGLSRVMPPPSGRTSVDPAAAVPRTDTASPRRPYRPTLFSRPDATEPLADAEQPSA